MDTVEITNENFDQYFRDARTTKAEQGDVLAKFSAVADFVEGQGKKDIIYLLKIDKAREAAQVMNRIHGAKSPWCYRVPRQIAQDLLTMDEKDVEKKAYEMVVEFLFWTKKECVPRNDQHWETLDVIQYNAETGEYNVKIEI